MNGSHAVLQATRLALREPGRDNNLLFIRALLAAAVIFSHCYLLCRYPLDPSQRWLHLEDMAAIALRGFFFLSGFLITGSGIHSASLTSYVRARALRIFPAMLVAVFACTVALGPVVTTLSTSSYFHDPATWAYLKQALLHNNPMHLPGVFAYGPPPLNMVNTPLWTLSSEWLMYILVLAGCLVWRPRQGARLGTRCVLVLAGTLLLTAQMLPFQRVETLRWGAWFVAGAVCYLLRHSILLSVPVALLAAVAELSAAQVTPRAASAVFLPVFCYVLLVAAYHPALDLPAYRRLGDYSYGLYIFAWPVQQCLLPRAAGDPIRLFLLSFPVALIIAVISWHALEKPMLKLKRRAPGTAEKPDEPPKATAPAVMAA